MYLYDGLPLEWLSAALAFQSSPDRVTAITSLQACVPGSKVVGPARVVECRKRDNLLIHRALAEAEPGEVIVVDAHGDLAGYWGEVLSTAAIAREVAGVVVHGGVRDLPRIRALPFPAWASGTGLPSTSKEGHGRLYQTLSIGRANISQGDLIVADDDAVVVVPKVALDDVLDSARRIQGREEEVMRRIRAGETTLAALGI